ncbi:hypothetical protein DFP73DRAFT_592750 [Morchella snyderi]|nr:hypothetical protein DFP73DRAFT_592750 [Morchella snyderi]
MSLPDRVSFPIGSRPKNIIPKKVPLQKGEALQAATLESMKKPDAGLCEITDTSIVRARPIMPVGPVPLGASFYAPLHPGSVTYSFGRSPVKFRFTPGKSSNISFEEFKETHLGLKRPVTRIECVDLDSDQEGEMISESPAIKRQRVGLSRSISIFREVKAEDILGVNREISSVRTFKVRPSTTDHISPQPEIYSANTIVKLAAAHSSKESTSISSPEMYKKIRSWLILYVSDHVGAFSESYWAACNQTLKEELSIPVHKDFLRKMLGQISKTLLVAEARKIRNKNASKIILPSPYSGVLPPNRESYLNKQIESSSITQPSAVNAQRLKRKASRELEMSDEERRNIKFTKFSPNYEELASGGSEKEIREKLLLTLLSSSGVSPAPQSPGPDRAPCPEPKVIHKSLLTFFSQFDYPPSIVASGSELTIDQAYWLVSYELKHSPPQIKRKPNGYWNTVTILFNSHFAVNREKRSIAETTARLMKHLREESR